MNYCHPCQRHLNGALACAGCGTPAEALSHYATPALSGHEPDTERAKAAPSMSAGGRRSRGAAEPAPGGHARGSRGARTPGGSRRGVRAESDGPGGREGRGGRGNRRGREGRGTKEGRGRRSHRRRGRTALLAVLGVVLAAGALSLARLAIEPNGDDHASDYVREATDVTAEPAPDPSSSHDIDSPGPVDGPSVAPDTDARTSGTGRPAASTGTGAPGGEGSAPPAATTTPSDGAGPSTEASSGPSPSGTPLDPAESGQPTGTAVPPQNPAPPAPSPTGTETCWFLFFCS
ncbi:SCO2400 family protein [Streptomyces atratus]|uniref:SCO2400 family protein n=1 Tax=Streptomyces atratus TaxID=1893 RepID=UPI0033FA28DD